MEQMLTIVCKLQPTSEQTIKGKADFATAVGQRAALSNMVEP